MRKILILFFLVLGFNDISVSAKVSMLVKDVVCIIYPDGKNNSHKMPMRYKEISLSVYGNSISVESGVDFQQFVNLEFYSADGTLIYEKQGSIVNGDVIEINPNVIEETAKISVILNGKEYIGIL